MKLHELHFLSSGGLPTFNEGGGGYIFDERYVVRSFFGFTTSKISSITQLERVSGFHFVVVIVVRLSSLQQDGLSTMLVLRHHDLLTLLSSLSSEELLRLRKSLHEVLAEYSSANSQSGSKSMIFQPQREVDQTKPNQTTLFMPASTSKFTGIKVVTVPEGGTVQGSINVFHSNGELFGVMNAEEITAFRTAMAVMIPLLQCPFSKSNVVVFGAGRQAEWHIKLALLLTDARRVTVVNRSHRERIAQLFQDLSRLHPGVKFDVLLKTSPESDERLQNTLREADVIFCCTPSTTPLFPSDYLDQRPRFISLIGSYKPHMQEIDSKTLLSGRNIYVDSKEACLVEAGELIKASVTEDLLIEIGELVNNRTLDVQGNVIFKCVGMGLMDIAVGAELLKLAKEKGLGFNVDNF